MANNAPPPATAAPNFGDIPDSTDWLQTELPQFEPLEQALRCQVCKEFYDTPMMTQNCSHTFCSLCIRRCLSNNGKCPVCKKDNQADKLLPNWAVGEIVAAFVAGRDKALEIARKATQPEGQPEEEVDETMRRGRNTGRKRKIEDTDIEEEDGLQGRVTRSRTSRDTRKATTPTNDGAFASTPIEVQDSEDEKDEFLPAGFHRCPICQKAMKEDAVYFHLDSCPGPKEQGRGSGRTTRSRSSRLSPFPKPPPRTTPAASRKAPATADRLPQLNYSLLKDNALRAKLQNLGIPSGGPRQLLQRRHTEWLHLWNSNCDSIQPKSKAQLLKELDVWERTQGGNAGTAPGIEKIAKKDFDGGKWANSNKGHFDELVRNARSRRAQPASVASTPPPTENQTPADGSNATTPNNKTREVSVAAAFGFPEPKQLSTATLKELYESSLTQGTPAYPSSYTPHPASGPPPPLPNPNPSFPTPSASSTLHPPPPSEPHSTNHPGPNPRPYENNHSALATIRRKVEEANNSTGTSLGSSIPAPTLPDGNAVGIQNPLAQVSPSRPGTRKVPMFVTSADPVTDVDVEARGQ